MSPKKAKQQLLSQLPQWMAANGYKETGREVWKKVYSPEQQCRYKVQGISLRKERRLSDGTWMRVKSGYLRDISITPEGVLRGMSVNGCTAKPKAMV
jgi:hypothetical protein